MVAKRPRAQRTSDKSIRKEAILRNALDLAERLGAAKFTMNELAFASGIAKATLYIYFETKEELLAEVLQGELDRWSASMLPTLADCRTGDASAAVDALAGAFGKEKLLAELWVLVDGDECSARTGMVLSELQRIAPGLSDAATVWRRLRAVVTGVHFVSGDTNLPTRVDKEHELRFFLAHILQAPLTGSAAPIPSHDGVTRATSAPPGAGGQWVNRF